MSDPEDQGPAAPKKARGRPFPVGNPGRKPGSKNRSTIFIAARLGEVSEEMMASGLKLVKEGSVTMNKFFLERMLPRGRPIEIDLPDLGDSASVRTAYLCIIKAMSSGTITPDEAAKVSELLKGYSEADEMTKLQARVDALEARLKGTADAANTS